VRKQLGLGADENGVLELEMLRVQIIDESTAGNPEFPIERSLIKAALESISAGKCRFNLAVNLESVSANSMPSVSRLE
jgi:hypothetical protein